MVAVNILELHLIYTKRAILIYYAFKIHKFLSNRNNCSWIRIKKKNRQNKLNAVGIVIYIGWIEYLLYKQITMVVRRRRLRKFWAWYLWMKLVNESIFIGERECVCVCVCVSYVRERTITKRTMNRQLKISYVQMSSCRNENKSTKMAWDRE